MENAERELGAPDARSLIQTLADVEALEDADELLKFMDGAIKIDKAVLHVAIGLRYEATVFCGSKAIQAVGFSVWSLEPQGVTVIGKSVQGAADLPMIERNRPEFPFGNELLLCHHRRAFYNPTPIGTFSASSTSSYG